MPTRCCVPGCYESGGHKFPSDTDLCMRWRVAIKRSSGKTKGLWKLGKHDVVYHHHFKASDFKDTLLGDKGRLKKNLVPSVFTFRVDSDIAITSPRALRLQSRQTSSADSCSLDMLLQGVQQEVEIESPPKPDDCLETGSPVQTSWQILH